MLFGRAQEEMDALEAAGIPFEVVPGVTAALAAAAELKVSLTNRGISRHVVFVTPRAAPDAAPNDWITPVTRADTSAIYMGAGEAAQLAAQLISHGRPADTPVVIVKNASLASSTKRCLTLLELTSFETETFEGPVLILIGEVYRRLLPQNPDMRNS
jgi:uroporphyrin-III C-methyltransferase